MLQINEIFRTIHGEVNGIGGQGVWTIVVRLQGCNLNCSFCDTKYAVPKKGGKEMEVGEVLHDISNLMMGKWHCKYNILITGGEPLLQTSPLVSLCKNLKRHMNPVNIAVETNGTVPITGGLRKYVDSFIVDFKPPDPIIPDIASNIALWSHLDERDYIKFLVGDKYDFEYALNIKDHIFKGSKANFVMSPIYDTIKPNRLLTMMEKSMRFDFGLNVQLHKIIGAK